jgi:GntR family transcriptional regulator, trigonelline degradation regulator
MADGLTQVRRTTAPVRQQVVDMLREAIVESRLKPGQRLIERELTEQTGVSRNVVREALRELAAEGLVTTLPSKGNIVATLTRKEALELFEIREVLESMATRQFVERASEAQMRAFRRSFEAIERAANSGRSLLACKDRFYEVMFEGAENPTITGILSGLHARITVLRASSLSQAGRPPQTVAEIRAIVEAAEARDASLAERLSVEHVRHAAKAAMAGLDHDADPEATEAVE